MLKHSTPSIVVAITGASSGIGEATALLLAERGAKVVLGARGLDGGATSLLVNFDLVRVEQSESLDAQDRETGQLHNPLPYIRGLGGLSAK